MRTATVTLRGTSPYQQCREKDSLEPRRKGESFTDYEERTWKLRAFVNEDGIVCIPSGSIKQALVEAAKYLGKGFRHATTFAEPIRKGVLVNPRLISTGVPLDEVRKQQIFFCNEKCNHKGFRD